MPFLSDILMLLLSLPVMLMALSVHESAHGYAAYKLGDPTAHSLGRITLNPVKHFDLFGFLSMLVFHIGWAKPVPINARYFKNPRRDFAIVGAAGPLSNICLALIHLLVLRLVLLFAKNAALKDTMPEGSYTTYLFQKGIDKILKKVGEESTEVIIAAKGNDKAETVYEIADLAYHVMVLMVEMGISLSDVREELASRHVIDHKVKQEKMT